MSRYVTIGTTRQDLGSAVPLAGEYLVIFGVILGMRFVLQKGKRQLVVSEIPHAHGAVHWTTHEHIFYLLIKFDLGDVLLVRVVRSRSPLCSAFPEVIKSDNGVFTSGQNQISLSCIQTCWHLILGHNGLLDEIWLFDVNNLERVISAPCD